MSYLTEITIVENTQNKRQNIRIPGLALKCLKTGVDNFDSLQDHTAYYCRGKNRRSTSSRFILEIVCFSLNRSHGRVGPAYGMYGMHEIIKGNLIVRPEVNMSIKAIF